MGKRLDEQLNLDADAKSDVFSSFNDYQEAL